MRVLYRDNDGCLTSEDVIKCSATHCIKINGCDTIDAPNLKCINTNNELVLFLFEYGTSMFDVERMVLKISSRGELYLSDEMKAYSCYVNPDYEVYEDMKKFIKITK